MATISNRVSHGVATIAVAGRFDFNLREEFEATTGNLLSQQGIKKIDLNLSQVDYIDSSALGILLYLKDKADSAHIKTFTLVGAGGLVKQVLEIAHFQKFFTLR